MTYVDVGDARLWSISFGPDDGPVLVAVGGWIGSWELWAGPFSVLSARWNVVGYDHRGSGATIAGADSISHDRLVDDVIAVLDAYGIERCVLAGESAGVGVVVSVAARHPDRVTGLVLVDGFIPEGSREDDPFVVGLRSDYDRTIEAFVQACVPDPEHEAIRHWGRQILTRSTPEHAVALIANAIAPWSDVARVTAPALVIHCDGDRVAPIESGRRLAAGLADATLHVLAGSEHVPTLTRPAEIAALIDERFGSTPSAGVTPTNESPVRG